MGPQSWPYIALEAFVIGVSTMVGQRLIGWHQQVRKARQAREKHNKRVRERTRHLSIAIGPHAERLDIRQVFVEPCLQPATEPEDREDGRAWTPRQALKHAVNEDQHGIVIEGMAGSGKTTLAQWLAYEMAAPKAPAAWAFMMRRWGRRDRERAYP